MDTLVYSPYVRGQYSIRKFVEIGGHDLSIYSNNENKMQMLDCFASYDRNELEQLLTSQKQDVQAIEMINKTYRLIMRELNYDTRGLIKSLYQVNILTIMTIYNKNDDSIIYIMDKYNIMPDFYTFYFACLVGSYDLVTKIGDKYFSVINNICSYNSSEFKDFRENMIKFIIYTSAVINQSIYFDIFEYILQHDILVLDILNPFLNDISSQLHYHTGFSISFMNECITIVRNHNIGTITDTYRKIMEKHAKKENFLPEIIGYVIDTNRWDLIVTEHIYIRDTLVIENGTLDMIKKFADMLDMLNDKFSYYIPPSPTIRRKRHQKTLHILTPYSIHLRNVTPILLREKNWSEMKLSLFEKDKYNSNTFSCVFPNEGIIEPVKYYTDTNIYRILDILDKCIAFNGVESQTNQIILNVSQPKIIFDKYITSLITGIIPLVDASITECVQFMSLIDEYPNRMLIMNDIHDHVITAFLRDIVDGNHIMDEYDFNIFKEICYNHELSELYMLIRYYERSLDSNNCHNINNIDNIDNIDIE